MADNVFEVIFNEMKVQLAINTMVSKKEKMENAGNAFMSQVRRIPSGWQSYSADSYVENISKASETFDAFKEALRQQILSLEVIRDNFIATEDANKKTQAGAASQYR